MIAALFDCDGTLYTAQFGRGVMHYARRQGRAADVRMLYASLAPLMLLRKLRLASDSQLMRTFIERLPRLMKGWDEQQGRAAFDWVVDDYLLPTQRADMIERLKDHLARGHAVLLVSGASQPAVNRLVEYVGGAGGVGTKFEINGGRYTGRIIPPVVKDEHKVRLARAFFEGRGMAIDWPGSYAYADSFSDRDMLEMVGHPVAVYPDAELHALAQAKHWEIVGTPR